MMTLSDGCRRHHDRLGPATQNLQHWNVDVDDFLPGRRHQTLHAMHSLTLDGPRAWSDIRSRPIVRVGMYTTTVNWSGGGGAYLDLGEVFDTYRARVNGVAFAARPAVQDGRRRPV